MFKNENGKINSFIAGFLGSLGLLGFYFLTTGIITGSWEFPWRQFLVFKFLMGALVLGFGVQVGLFWHLRHNYRATVRGSNAKMGVVTGANAGISGLAMVACCAHHLTEVVPILGLAGLSLFLVNYQKELLILGVLANLGGIIFMIKRLKKTRC